MLENLKKALSGKPISRRIAIKAGAEAVGTTAVIVTTAGVLTGCGKEDPVEVEKRRVLEKEAAIRKSQTVVAEGRETAQAVRDVETEKLKKAEEKREKFYHENKDVYDALFAYLTSIGRPFTLDTYLRTIHSTTDSDTLPKRFVCDNAINVRTYPVVGGGDNKVTTLSSLNLDPVRQVNFSEVYHVFSGKTKSEARETWAMIRRSDLEDWYPEIDFNKPDPVIKTRDPGTNGLIDWLVVCVKQGNTQVLREIDYNE
jgi:hypothetical protein